MRLPADPALFSELGCAIILAAPVTLVTLQLGIVGVVVGHDFVDVPGPFVGIVVVPCQQRLEALVACPANQVVYLPRLRVDGDRLRDAQLARSRLLASSDS